MTMQRHVYKQNRRHSVLKFEYEVSYIVFLCDGTVTRIVSIVGPLGGEESGH